MTTLIRNQILPVGIKTAWQFFSDPMNLKEITPEYMGFDILSEINSEEIYPGMIIKYKVRPIFNIPVTWVTEISQVKKPFYFIDEQIAGPYQFWHHQHFFIETRNGTEMKDIVNYKAPFGWFGKLAESVIIDTKVKEIFDYRFDKLQQIFN